MPVYYLRNNLNPEGKIVPITVSLALDSLVPGSFPVRIDQDPAGTGTDYPNLADLEGGRSWILIVATRELDTGGNPIDPEYINVVTTGTVHQELQAAYGRIGNQIDWGTLATDIRPPQLESITPALNETTDVPITSNIVIRLLEDLPAAGIDLSTLNVKLNGFDITNDFELSGNIFDLTMRYVPTKIIN